MKTKRILDGLQALLLTGLLVSSGTTQAADRTPLSAPTATTSLSSTRTAPTTTVRVPAPTIQPKTTTLSCERPISRQGLRPRWTAKKSFANSLPPGSDPMRLVLKLQDDACANASNGVLSTSSDRHLQSVAQTIAQYAPGARVRRRFEMNDKSLEGARQEGERNIGQRLADFRQYYWIDLAHASQRSKLVEALLGMRAVENVYAQPPVAPDPGDIVSPETPDFSAEQDFWNAAPGGLDFDFAHFEIGESLGGKGGASTIADIETAWNFDHEDLSQSGPYMLYDLGEAGEGLVTTANDHGTAVSGILVADEDRGDATGIRGVASGAGYLAVPTIDEDGNLDIARAILDVAVVDPTRRLGARGIALIEKQVYGPNWSPGQASDDQYASVPVEYLQAEFDAIKQATALGVTVIEAGANGEQDLDARSGPSGHPNYGRFDPRVRHSGAILVGSASSAAPHEPRPSSSRGERVDTYAWGENIFTLGYGSAGGADGFPAGDFDPNQRYTESFGGTSGASALVTGAAAILESIHFVEHHGVGSVRNGDPTALRLLLRTTGTESADPAADRIGRQPDLREQIPLVQMGPNVASVFTGEANQTTGSAIAPIEDIDYDGIGDIIVGSPNGNLVTVYSGLSGDPIIRYTGATGQRFGAAVSAIDDLDGDGRQDVLIGAPGANQVQVRSTQGLGDTLFFAASNLSGSDFGAAVASQPDVNGDGRPEVLIGAPLTSTNGPESGSVYAYTANGYGGQTLWPTKHGGAGARFGTTIVTGDVLFGDGKADILIGAPANPTDLQNNAFLTGEEPGRVHLYQAGGQAWQIYEGASEKALFGASIAIIGDRDGDGIDDFAVGSPNDEQRGSVNIHSGHTGGVLMFKYGQDLASRFGASVAGPGDLDGDGIVDVLVGAPDQDWNGTVSAISLSLANSPVLATYTGEAYADDFGAALATIGDLNGDGQVEFIAGSPLNSRGGSLSGAAYVFILPSYRY